MSLGGLDDRISLQRVTLTADGQGGSTESWSEYAAVWARVRPMKGRERQASERQEATADYVVRIRYRDDVLEADKIVWRGREMNIRFIPDGGPRAHFLDIEAEMGAAV